MTKARDIASAIPAPSTVSATELGYLDGVSSAVQTQLNAKEATLPSQTGNSGKYLTTDGSAKSWGAISAGGMTLLSTTTLSGSSTTISSISQDYVNLYAIITGVQLTGGNVNYRFRCAPNGTTNITSGTVVTVITADEDVDTYLFLTTSIKGNNVNEQILEIANYSSTTAYKPFTVNGLVFTNADKGSMVNGAIKTNTAISSLVFSPSTDTFSAGTVKLYGVK